MGISNRLSSTAVVNRKSRVSDSVGGNTYTYTTSIASLACRVSMKSSTERFLGDKVDSNASHTIFVLSGSDIKLSDQFVVGSNTYTVVGINEPSRGTHVELDVELIRTGA
jgi:head-tail adaptor